MQIVVPEEFRYLFEESEERPVVKIPAPILRQRATEVGKVSKKTQLLVDELLRIMRKANGVGLAAPQIGIGKRVIVVAPEGDRPTALINPVILGAEGERTGEEGCLSIPGLYGDVTRPAEVEVEALDRRGRVSVYRMKGMAAKVVQHEIDHLDGILFTDKVDPATLHWIHPEATPVPAE
jgi:peptide deformylase